jgi:LPS export ABC transporter protein LptC
MPFYKSNNPFHTPAEAGQAFPKGGRLFNIFSPLGKMGEGVIFRIFCFLAVVFISSCETKVETIKKSEILSLPSMTNRDITTVYTDSGKVQLIMRAPLIETYSNDESPYSEFREGINVVFFEGKKDSVGYATAKYAKYLDKKKLWELRDSVVVLNGSNDRLETEQLFWDQDKDLIYTDRFVKIINEDQTLMGTGFESDIKLNKRKIKSPSGPIYLKDE